MPRLLTELGIKNLPVKAKSLTMAELFYKVGWDPLGALNGLGAGLAACGAIGPGTRAALDVLDARKVAEAMAEGHGSRARRTSSGASPQEAGAGPLPEGLAQAGGVDPGIGRARLTPGS